jgi:hypothetical protein
MPASIRDPRRHNKVERVCRVGRPARARFVSAKIVPEVQSLNRGVRFNAAALELLLPNYGEQLGLKGNIQCSTRC